jgi:hypothetical protein
MNLLKKELGLEQDEKESLSKRYEERIQSLKVPAHALKVIRDEMVLFQLFSHCFRPNCLC